MVTPGTFEKAVISMFPRPPQPIKPRFTSLFTFADQTFRVVEASVTPLINPV